jgi:hypothetical protein
LPAAWFRDGREYRRRYAGASIARLIDRRHVRLVVIVAWMITV